MLFSYIDLECLSFRTVLSVFVFCLNSMVYCWQVKLIDSVNAVISSCIYESSGS